MSEQKSRLGKTDDPDRQLRDQQLAEILRESADAAWRKMLRTTEGRQIAYDLVIDYAKLMGPSHRGRGADDTFFREGEREVGRKVLALVQRLEPELWLLAMSERERRLKKLRAELDRPPKKKDPGGSSGDQR